MATEESGGLWMFNRPDLEPWHGGHYATRDEAVAAAVYEAAEYDCETMEVGRCQAADVTLPDGGDIIDLLRERACGKYGDSTEGWLDGVTAEQEAKLTAELRRVVTAWLNEAGMEPMFRVIADIETIPTPQRVDEVS